MSRFSLLKCTSYFDAKQSWFKFLRVCTIFRFTRKLSYNTKIYLTKILGLDICADTLVGDEMLKGISGGQKKRLTTGVLVF